ncbi:adenine phosphoribosyltransferase [bacterium]|nr:adenine phosphoribosyltransferase [bacterium]
MPDIKKYIRDIPDFPKKGIIFKDITPLLKDPAAFSEVIDIFYQRYKDKNIDYIAGIEARGFIVGSALALKLNKGFIPIRKKGKLPYKTVSADYDLEYGIDTIQMHCDALEKGNRVLLVDDLIATGGTLEAAAKMIGQQNADLVEIALIIELEFLKGKDRLTDFPVFSLIKY